MWEPFRVNATGKVEGLEREAVAGGRRNLRLLAEFAGMTPPENPADWPAFTSAVKWPLLDALLASRFRYAAINQHDKEALSFVLNHFLRRRPA